MRTFKDSLGRTHTIDLNAATAMRVKGHLGVDLFRAFEDGAKVLNDLALDGATRVLVIYMLCGGKPGDGYTPEEVDFCRGVDGDTLDAMTQALQEEVVNFSPKRARNLIHEVQERSEEARTLLEARARARIAAMTPERLARQLENA